MKEKQLKAASPAASPRKTCVKTPEEFRNQMTAVRKGILARANCMLEQREYGRVIDSEIVVTSHDSSSEEETLVNWHCHVCGRPDLWSVMHLLSENSLTHLERKETEILIARMYERTDLNARTFQ